MNDFFSRLSKGTLAALAIGGGILLLLLFDPPHSLCDTEIETLREAQANVLFVSAQKKKFSKTATSAFAQRYADCMATNRPGGCYEMFSQLRELLTDLRTISEECREDAGDVREVKAAIWDGLELMVKIAWGSQPPASYTDKHAWLDSSDLSLYCNLKRAIPFYYSKAHWEKFRERMLKELPGADKLSRGEAWEKMLLSTNCSRYL